MITEIYVPKIGMTQEDIKVVQWLKADGESCEKDQNVVIIETAKVSYEIEAPASGLVFHLKKVKDRVKVGDVLGVVSESRQAFDSYKEHVVPVGKRIAEDTIGEDEEGGEGVHISFEEETEEGPAPAQAKIDDDRRILKKIPFVGMRRTIAEHLVSSLQVGAQLTIVSETDVSELSNYRAARMLDRPDEKITFVDIMVKLLPFVLKEFPIINSAVAGDEVVCWGEYHIGVAVALDGGLVVPVVRDVDQKGLSEVSKEIKKLSKKARNNELRPEDYRGGTFTLSSGGKVEVDIITPIINPPQNAILAFGKIGPRPAVHENKLCIRTMTNLCLTHDHRVIDGVPAAMFLGRLKEVIETPDLFMKILL